MLDCKPSPQVDYSYQWELQIRDHNGLIKLIVCMIQFHAVKLNDR